MLGAAGQYGAVTALSQEYGISRTTLYDYKRQAEQAIREAFDPAIKEQASEQAEIERARLILNLLMEGHASYRGIARCYECVMGESISLGTITSVVQEAGRRARAWFACHAPACMEFWALDELYDSSRRAYLSVVDPRSKAVWAVGGPMEVLDREVWALMLWYAQEQGVQCERFISDGGAAIQAGCKLAAPEKPHHGDVWHVLNAWSREEHRLERQHEKLVEQTATVAKQAERVAQGQKPLGRCPKTDLAAHGAETERAGYVVESVHYLGGQLRDLLGAVVLSAGGVLSEQARREELKSLEELLQELEQSASQEMQPMVRGLIKHLERELPRALAFVAQLEAVEQRTRTVIGEEGLSLTAWAWQRRRILQPASVEEVGSGTDLEKLAKSLGADWEKPALEVMQAWSEAVRASSAIENWHSILRPHLAVHRELYPGMLELIAVWHNHRCFARGIHKGRNPLQLSGIENAPTDWRNP
jgi:transposase-like protein